MLQYLELNSTERFSNVSDQQSALSRDVLSNSGKTTDETSQAASPSFTVKSVKPGLSPGDVVQAEQQNPSESDASSESCDEHLSPIERSHPLKRSGSQRRSASPMRRIQIGRSGSRRSAAIAIKSLNYFATRERTVHNVDTEGKNSDDDESDRSSENHKTSVNKMSVQNAISIFESKQKDQSLNFYKNGSDVATSIANKSVLRRWSAGMCDYRNQDTRRNTSKSELRRESDNLLPAAEGENISEMKSEPNIAIFYQNKVEAPAIERSLMEDIMTSASTNDHVHLDAPANNRFRMGGAGEWTQQKEADINQILLKMTENKPSESHRSALESGGNKETCGEKRGDFYSQYKEKRDEKLRSETARQRAEKELQFKMMQEALDQRKAEMHSNALAAPGKLDSSSHPQKSRRNSCPPVLPRKEPSKSAVSKKPAPKSSSPKPITHSSSPSTPSSRTMGVASARSSSRTLSSNTPTLRKPQPALPSTNSGPDTEKSLLRPSGSSGSQAQGKIAAKSKENKKQSSLSSRRISRTKVSAQGNDSNEVLAKADLRSKVTKKSSVVPLEAKPFLKKGGLRSVAPATLPPQSDGSLRTGGNPAQEEKKDPVVGMADSIPQPSDEASTRTTPGNGENSENVSNYDVNQETTEDLAPVPGAGLPSEKNQPDEDLGVSSGPWEEPGIAHQGPSEACGSSMARAAASSAITPVPSPGPLLHHPPSLISEASHTEKEITEWGNAEKPPALVYHKDPPKGLRRLFMFGRSTPSLFSKGRGDAQEEGKSASKRSGDAQEEGFGPQKTALSEIHDGGPSSRASMDACAASDFPPGTDPSIFSFSFSFFQHYTAAVISFFGISIKNEWFGTNVHKKKKSQNKRIKKTTPESPIS